MKFRDGVFGGATVYMTVMSNGPQILKRHVTPAVNATCPSALFGTHSSIGAFWFAYVWAFYFADRLAFVFGYFPAILVGIVLGVIYAYLPPFCQPSSGPFRPHTV